MGQYTLDLAGKRVNLADPVNLVPKKFHPQSGAAAAGRKDLQRVAPHPELVAHKVNVVTLVLNGHQLFNQRVPAPLHTGAQRDHHIPVINGVADRINAGHGGHNDHIPPLGQCRRGAVAQLVDLVVNSRVLFNISVRCGHVSLRLIVVVVGNKILHRIFRKEFPKLAAKLGSQGLVMRQHQSGSVHPLNNIGHGKGFAGAGDPHQGLLLHTVQHAPGQLLNCLRLIAGGLKLAV